MDEIMKRKITYYTCSLILTLTTSVTALHAEPLTLTKDKTLATYQQKINFNTATLEQLKIPKLIGEKRALAILAWRDKNEKVRSFDELLKAKDLNIGVKIISALKEKFTIN